MSKDYIIAVDDDYVDPEGPIANDEDYLTRVLNYAAASYQSQYGTTTKGEGITAARERYNADLPVAPVEPEDDA